MNIYSRTIKQLAIASVIAAGLVSTGLAASAQTAAATSATTVTNVSMSTLDAKAAHEAELEQAIADARRVAFRNLGTSL